MIRAHGHSKRHFLWLLHVSLISDCLFSIFFFFGDIPWKFSEHIAYFFFFLVFCSSCSLVKKLDSLNLSQIDLQLSNRIERPTYCHIDLQVKKKKQKTVLEIILPKLSATLVRYLFNFHYSHKTINNKIQTNAQ